MAVIFYFSGTGNSFSVARKLGKELDARVEGISGYLREPYTVEDELVGFVTPVFCLALPPVVKTFLEKVHLVKPVYIFGVATMGAMAGQTLSQAENILSLRGLSLNAGFKIALPDSSIVFPTTAKVNSKMLSDEETEVAKMALAVKKRAENDHKSNFLFVGSMVESVGWWVMKNFYGIDRKTVSTDKCIQCGLCVKICPADCIKMKDGYPFFGENCVSCFACAQWCPMQAISLGKLIPDEKTQYGHPQVNAEEIALQKETK